MGETIDAGLLRPPLVGAVEEPKRAKLDRTANPAIPKCSTVDQAGLLRWKSVIERMQDLREASLPRWAVANLIYGNGLIRSSNTFSSSSPASPLHPKGSAPAGVFQRGRLPHRRDR